MTTNNKLLPIKIKIEPGTTKIRSMLHDGSISIKIEPGTSQRLTSLKLPRDLKLGGSKTKVVKPNLNVIRHKRNDIASPTASQGRGGRGRGRGRGSDRGRGSARGGRHSQNTVQSLGVFSEGIAESMLKRNSQYADRLREDKDYDASKVMDRPTINKNIELKVDKDHEDMIMNELLNINLDPDEMDVDNDLYPVRLPINRTVVDTKIKIKLEPGIKEERKPFENRIVSTKDMFEAQEKLLLFQFPDSLPGIGPSKEEDPKPNTSATTSNDKTAETEKQTENKCTLQDINEGLLGKIVIYKSGKTKLVIGNSKFDIELGPESGFLQDVMSIPVNPSIKSGDMINLGSLEGNVIITPEWDNLLHIN